MLGFAGIWINSGCLGFPFEMGMLLFRVVDAVLAVPGFPALGRCQLIRELFPAHGGRARAIRQRRRHPKHEDALIAVKPPRRLSKNTRDTTKTLWNGVS